ncbi:MAG TPA: DegT/DnrJ/EryC1/StrS family aminotransferase [Caldilineaceae bacterium]|nr:DegT/DnrJ/EryC1/StrS family aminotransferase [Caldilineaceae bacterium]
METQTAPVSQADLALYGGPKAFPQMEGRPQPKIGVAEFLSIAERFGFSPEALERIRNVIADEDLGRGPNLAKYATAYPPQTKGAAFEARARDLFGVRYALGVSSGTAALHCAMVAAGVGPGAEVIVPAIGFYATAAMVVAAKGVPIFCDVDESLHMDPRKLEALITPRTVAIAPTHVMGSICDLEPILAIARRHGLKVIEDCAQSPGGRYRGRPVGAWGDLGCFSISAYKIIGGGEGGLVITNDERLWERANQFAEAGGLWRPDRFAPPRYPGELFNGLNYRMSELEAAVDVVQLDKLAGVVERFHQVKMRILGQLKRFHEITPQKLNDVEGEIGYVLRFFPATVALGKQMVEALNAEGIACRMHAADPRPDWHLYADMFPITLKTGTMPTDQPFDLPIYRERGGEVRYERGLCPVADDLFSRQINVPLNQWYTPNDCDRVAAGINKVLAAYCTEDPSAPAWL